MNEKEVSRERQGDSISEEEIKKMLIEIPGISIARKARKDGRYQGYVTVKDEKVYVYGRDRADVAIKIKHILRYGAPKKKKQNALNGIPQTFDGFVQYYFEKFRRRKLAERTYQADVGRYNRHLKPRFGAKLIKKISPGECQDLIDKLTAEGKSKTADEIYSLLSVIFKGAISHGIITKNPLAIVYKEKHERKHGSALTGEEIAKLKRELIGTAFMQPFMILLYTGLRPNELATVQVKGKFIVAVNSKRKTKRVEYKKSP